MYVVVLRMVTHHIHIEWAGERYVHIVIFYVSLSLLGCIDLL